MNPARRRVAITGMGAVSPYGEGAGALWRGLRDGVSAIRPLRHAAAGQVRVKVAAQVPEDVDLASRFAENVLPLLDRTSQFALLAAREAVAQAGLDFATGGLDRRTAVVIGTGVGGEDTHDEQARRLYAEGAARLHPLTIVRMMPNAAAAQVSMAHGLRGPTFGVVGACASSNHALAQAALLIRAGLADVAISGGTEACLTFSALRAWEAMRVLSDDTCRPFSRNRRGLVLGEGAGVFVLEAMDHARARGAVPLAELAGIGMGADAGDIAAPDPAGGAAAIAQALADAELAADEVDYINAHGTGTRANDSSETQAIHRAFGTHASRLLVSSTKSMHGHALGAAGALELVAVLGAMGEGVAPPTANLDEPDPACDLDYVPNVGRECSIRAALSNSFAFGGLNAVLALRRV